MTSEIMSQSSDNSHLLCGQIGLNNYCIRRRAGKQQRQLQQVEKQPEKPQQTRQHAHILANINNTNQMHQQRAKSRQPTRFAMNSGKAYTTRAKCTALVLLASLLLAALVASADYAPQQQQQQQQEVYGQQQQQQNYEQQLANGQSKAKKIQIVYIKVPLAKLKPSLANGEYAAGQQQADSNATYSAGHKTQAGHDSNDKTKPHGSQSDQQQLQQQQVSIDELGAEHDNARQQSSFLIPMAVVQHEPSTSHSGQMATFSSPLEASNNFIPSSGSGSRRSRQQQSPMQVHHHQQLTSAASVNHGINHGFMSSFLSGEKEKMISAAIQLHQSQSAPPASPLQQQIQLQPQQQQQQQQLQTASSQATGSQTNQQVANQMITNNLTDNRQTTNHQQGPGGLMPLMMLPFTHMPDNMIGQAYNAAVGQALPVESGSPTSMLNADSSSTSYNSNTNKAASNNNNNNYGGNSGTHGADASSLGTTSSGSYGSNGQSHSESSSSGSAYPRSVSASGATGPSSGYGSGTNTFGASVAFSDFPTGQSIGSGPITYNTVQQQQQQQMSNNNNNYNHQVSHSNGDQGSLDQLYANQKLRQAKKTIIPIVVQVEHAVLENNGAQNVGNNNNYGQQQQQQQHRGNRYAARGQRQSRGRGRKNQQHQQVEQQYRNNGLHGSATNEVGMRPMEFGTSGQYINAANAHDINQITAAINAENAASAAAALAQADAAFGGGSPAYLGNPGQQHQQRNPGHQARPNQAGQYGGGSLQSAASALLANTHPVIQAAASGGLASVSKLGAKLGEMIALPSMPNSMSALPSALSSISNTMGVQLGQAVQQVAKEHPMAHAYVRQVAQQAGISLPQLQGMVNSVAPQGNGPQGSGQQQQQQQQMMMGAHSQPSMSQMSAQSQLQNLKLSIGQNLQTAAAQLMGTQIKGNSQSAAATILANPMAALYPPAVTAALKQLSGMNNGANQQQEQNSLFSGNSNKQIDPHHAQSSSLVASLQQPQQQQQQSFLQNQNQQQQQASPNSDLQSALLGSASESSKSGKSSSLKSKFLSFFQPPKFISNLLSWNDRADERNDKGASFEELPKAKKSEISGKMEPTTKVEEKKSVKPEEPKVNSTIKTETVLTAKTVPVEITNSSSKIVSNEQQPKVVKVEVVSNSTSSKN